MRKEFAVVFVLLAIIAVEGYFIFSNDDSQKGQAEAARKGVDLVTTNVGFNPVFYPIEHNKIPQPAGVKINLKTADYGGAQFYTLSFNDRPLVGILSNINVGITYNEGYKFKVLAPYYREIVGPDGKSMGQLVIKKDSPIQDPKDLYGKKVADTGKMGGSTIALKTVMREKYGLDLDKINFVTLNPNTLPELLERGEIDAAMFDSDYILVSDFDQRYRTLIDFSKDMKELYGVVPPAKYFVVKKELYDEDPELYEKTVQFFRDNYQWGVDNIEMIAKEEAESTGKDYQEILKHVQYESRLGEMKSQDLKATKAFYETAKAEGIIEKIPDLTEIFDIPAN